ncbi:MAG: efflux RND transporter permease subunit [Myxococcales bacterium]|nr:efflux RND transporter permease subunit [Myxococcales bacterium]
MWLSDISVRRPVLATVASALLVSFGVLSFSNLSLREMPAVDPPIISIETVYRGASPAVVENRVTKPIEKRISGVEGIRTLSSDSSDGVSRISIEFELWRSIDDAAADIRDRVSQSLDDIPDEADAPEIFKAEADSNPIMWLNLTSAALTPLELTDYAERYIIDRFAVLDGVARIRLSGERRYAMRIWLDRIALAARQLTVADVETALRSQNVELPAGRLESIERDFTVRVERSYRTPEDFEQLVVARGDRGHLVRLREVARVEVGPEEWRSDFRGNGQPRIGVGIIRQSDANTLSVARGVIEEIERIKPTLPKGVDLDEGWDSSVFVEAAVKEVYFTLGLSVLLVVGVIYLFLGTKRAALVPAVSVPICLISTFGALYVFGLSVNLLTLLAIVLSIGLVVDDSIVVLENVQRRIELGEPTLVAAYRGASEVGFAVMATTLVVIAVFVPIAFLEGLTGRLFRELAITVSAAVAISSVVALSLSAMLCSKLLVPKDREQGISRRTHERFERLRVGYGRALRFCVRRPLLIAVGLAVVLAAVVVLFANIDSELEPFEDRGAFMTFMVGPEGASFDYTLRHMKQLEEQVMYPLLDAGEAAHILARVPGSFGGGEQMNTGFIITVLTPWNDRERSAKEIVADLHQKLKVVPGVRASPVVPGGLGSRGSGRPVQFVIGGASHDEVGEWQDRLIARASEIEELVNVQGDYRPTRPQVRIDIDRSRAADLGVSVETVGRTLETMLGSRRVTKYVDRGEEYDVIVQAMESQRASPGDLTNLFVRSDTSGELIPLSSLVTTREIAAPSTLRRFNRLPAATIEANLGPGLALGEALERLHALAREELPATAQFDFKGISREFRESSLAAYFTFGLALLVVFLVLAAQFESFVHPLVIMLTVPLAIAGALIGLLVMGGTLNIYSQIGMTILIGLAAKNGILIVEFANRLRDAGREFDDAVLEAAETRLRPILMTGISTAVGALPLILGGGAGAGGRGTIGVVVFSGVLFATFFTLFVVPVAYVVLARRTQLPGAVAQRLEELERGVPSAAGAMSSTP